MAARKNPGTTPSGKATRPIQRDPLLQTALDREQLRISSVTYAAPKMPRNQFIKSGLAGTSAH
jgi:hypothetical protein